MKDWWLKFGCFLTGFNYSLVKNSSEQSSKNVKKYTSAMLLIVLIWFFIGYSFATRYLHLAPWGGIVGGLLMGFVIIQIERIIILSTKISPWSSLFRILLALVMSILGAFIMDQITFKDDIELRKAEVMDQRVKAAVQQSENDIQKQLHDLDVMIAKANHKYDAVSADLKKNPVIVTSYTNRSVTRDEKGKEINTTQSTNKSVMENPKKLEMEQLHRQIEALQNKKFELAASITTIKERKEKELKAATGFLDELNLLHDVVTSSRIGLFVYLLFLFFFLAIELFVLVIKLTDKESDYDKLIQHQTDVRVKMLEKLRVP
ncbi:uncharacterized protein DUF4407 [Sphingobacterium allocomposti]|uniref:Uncharacterized protein DUF4407 n=1 Tax=Sphingobacterium allocomposti TaxID=415956 RepID=A0A5S5DQN8_9SPHI|nr:DUF4407 domain-containing protein [Sphingobacterium composti Yoo et al. 2007 non Ten et al. 2007]TYP96979.1 uncharacterized protein DUF4407 [Sphingobacterium composti Yoo et al. 2007 non Ten et al. 2007]HLS94275.1 DUF4407 domain-containing protein [Sphingobacterium sp.]